MTDTITTHVLDKIPFTVDRPALMKKLRVKEGSLSEKELNGLLAQAAVLAQPRALLMEAYVTARGEEWVEIEGRRFQSRVLSVNLEQAHRVFPYLATCGPELHHWSEELKECDDMLLSFWAEAIKEAALFCASQALDDYLKTRIHPGKTARMNPGSLADWPLEQQQVLFSLLGDTERSVGVQLTDSLLMLPNKTVSGIFYPTEIDFASCQLCPRENCPNRRAPYDPGLYASRYSP